MRPLSNHERRRLTPAQRALVNTDPEARVADLKNPDVGGYTVSPVTGNKPDRGIAVSQPGHEEVHKTDSLTKEAVARWAVHPNRIREWTRTPGIHYGGWTEEGKSYLDVSRVHDDTPEGRLSARRDAVSGNQIASFDLGTWTTEHNPLHRANMLNEHAVPTEQTRAEYLNDEGPIRSNRVSFYRDQRVAEDGFDATRRPAKVRSARITPVAKGEFS